MGTGWNDVEYEALGENFHNRGKRQEEQVTLMRELWTKDSVSFEGKWHKVTKAGLNPLPSRQIPIWFGGTADAVIDRAARMGDGWLPLFGHKQSKSLIERLHEKLTENGRSPAEFGIQAQAQIAKGNPDRWAKNAEAWRDIGTTHLAIATMNAGLKNPQEHIDAIRSYKESVS